ncbi:hypothetical protein [Bradyrhizobium sp. AUGA SZCCT0431]|uniref:hypothetical protein n=1 Tax=Bradyrhizobium sp. AUGA SZCCT0431 TaxID=2807674 RepID=UPI001BA79254|nr:hypothetical protein [Bradyrhizobium sp. AUGA SZCCT0431]MBR1146682.1 hypothetical protein [Bradyrhizobium sp. AUGA SZCCT0431]
MTKSNVTIAALIVLIALTAVAIFSVNTRGVVGAAPAGLRATVGTTTNLTVSTTAFKAFGTTTCASRKITTGASPIMITFTEKFGQTPTGSFGHLQAASTTVDYDGGVNGCDALKIYSYATQLITVTETN